MWALRTLYMLQFQNEKWLLGSILTLHLQVSVGSLSGEFSISTCAPLNAHVYKVRRHDIYTHRCTSIYAEDQHQRCFRMRTSHDKFSRIQSLSSSQVLLTLNWMNLGSYVCGFSLTLIFSPALNFRDMSNLQQLNLQTCT